MITGFEHTLETFVLVLLINCPTLICLCAHVPYFREIVQMPACDYLHLEWLILPDLHYLQIMYTFRVRSMWKTAREI